MPAHSISGSPLAIPFRRAHLTAFWLVAAAGGAAAGAAVAAAAGAQMLWPWAVVGGGSLLAPRAVAPAWFETGVWAWNGAARRAAAILRGYVLFVCYYTIVAAVGAASGLRWHQACRPAARWSPHSRATGSTLDASAPPAALHHALAAYARSSPRSRWSTVLIPIVVLLDVLRDDVEERVPPSSTYTLY